MVNRITGITSGLDTDTLISQLMKANRIPVDKMAQQKQTVEWQRDAYKEINAKILDFRNNKLFNFKREGTFAAKTLTTVGDTSAVGAKATSSSVPGTLKVEVVSLAQPSVSTSTAAITADPAFKTNVPLKDTEFVAGFTPVAPATTPPTYQEFDITVNSKVIRINPNTDSLDSMMSKISSQAGVTAFYDSTNRVVSMSGGGQAISVAGDFLTNTLKLGAGSAPVDAQLKINGVATTRASNSFSVNGVDITLNGVGTTTIDVKSDTDKVMESIKTFITDYNSMLKTIQEKLGEDKFRDYTPLTSEQKEAMKDKDIELWEGKAKSGLLRNDSILSALANTMRSSMSTPVETGNPNYKTLSAIGIDSGSYLEKGQLYIKSETKLREAIEKDPQAVINLFTQDGNGDTDRSDVGVGERLYQDLMGSLEKIAKKAGTSAFSDMSVFKSDSDLGKRLTDLNTRIAKGNERLADIENRYYKQFAAMEAAMSKYNSQSSYLANAFSS
ncbi:flagellar capping protein [Paenibacillus mucilaginosus 3016]|uniref:Flagellar hook-associated protein 2 n=1 Tax=Paenibacillus mucilaginosus 3016 TaxID=1116391 RepID=H6NT80_9BACL|nr:flagellar filament capping protein FliD [Paenibacillus mucilaginosus]AFC27093.1 flagellar capping protein [Paenibacillus mucilaginosus 3016]WFA16030.1 flagellar cap protein FliD [Paenibacillus mucilaginosus]